MARTKYIYNWDEVPVIVDVGYVCVILGVTANTVQRLLRTGRLKGFKVCRDWRINKVDLMAFVNAKKEKST